LRVLDGRVRTTFASKTVSSRGQQMRSPVLFRCGSSLFLLCCLVTIPLVAGELPVAYLDHVVAIGRKDQAPGANHGKWVGEGTGFFYGEFRSRVDDKTASYQPFLVTNRHVIEEHMAATEGPLSIRLNMRAGSVEEVDLPLALEG